MQTSFWDSDFISSEISPEMGLLDPMVVLFLTVWGSSKLFSVVAEPLFISTNSGYLFSTSSSILLITVSLMMTTVTDMKWYLVVLISISLTFSDVEHLFMDLLVICTSLGKDLFISGNTQNLGKMILFFKWAKMALWISTNLCLKVYECQTFILDIVTKNINKCK